MLLAVKTSEVATPEALVAAVLTLPANVPLAAPGVAGGVKVTITPLLTVLPCESFTVTESGAKGAPICTLWGEPLLMVMAAGSPAVLVSAKGVARVAPGVLAPTATLPLIEFAVNTAEVATPDALVVAVAIPLANVPLA